ITAARTVDAAEVRAALAPATKIAVLTDANVARAHPGLAAALGDLVVEIAPGEGSKSFATYERLCRDLVRGLDRGSAIVALGGGVVGDLAGFCAATLFRGIPIAQVPTSLVAMVDAAIGGKTGIDAAGGKNLVGAFHQPRLVACGTQVLATLPARERRAGFGELWKYALLGGRALWERVAACAPWSAAGEGAAPPPELDEVIAMSIAYKAAIVSRDELERSGQRALLNLGHTIGHAIESAGMDGDPRGALLHGEAVALGLVAACRVSQAVHGSDTSLERELVAALAASGLLADVDRWLTPDVIGRVALDKKRAGNVLRYVTIAEMGACTVTDITALRLQEILRRRVAP
ncbi:MAG: 3-dehydroquinate synthase, partial [Deltaproteobacteria bacterium]|nr:3-dehydroquinate synthase [Deltaproteobacteria bacterium]